MSEKITKSKKINPNLVSKIVRVLDSNSRKDTKKTKKRGEISGGGKKPFKQKGTGRARAGSNRSPIWRGGGVIFGPTGVENHKLIANKKEKQLVKKAALSEKNNVTKKLALPKITKTKEAAEFLKKNELKDKTLILGSLEVMKEIRRYFSNIPTVTMNTLDSVSTKEILTAKSIVIIEATTKKEKNDNDAPSEAKDKGKK